MNHFIDIQIASENKLPVDEEHLTQWGEIVLNHQDSDCELTIRCVDEAEMQHLNKTYRHQDKTTNVLAFPAELPEGIHLETTLLGDVIICPAVLAQEAKEQNIPIKMHWAHIVIHGILHLLGYDHIKDDDAVKMQAEEIKYMALLNYPNPYDTHED